MHSLNAIVFKDFKRPVFSSSVTAQKNVGFIFESATRTNSKENSMWPFANYVNQILRIFNQGSSVQGGPPLSVKYKR